MSKYFQNFPTVPYDLYFNGQTYDVTDIFRIVKVKPQFKDDVTFYTYYDIQDGERPDVVSTRLYGSPNYYWTFFMVNDHLVNSYKDWPLSTTALQELIEHKYPGIVLTTDEDISRKFSKNTLFEGLISGARARLVEKDPTLGLIKISPISGNFRPNEIARDIVSNEFVVIKNQINFKDAVHHYTSSRDSFDYEVGLNESIAFRNAVNHYKNAAGVYVNKNDPNAIPVTNEEYEFFLNDAKSKIKVIRPTYIQTIADQFLDQIKSTEE